MYSMPVRRTAKHPPASRLAAMTRRRPARMAEQLYAARFKAYEAIDAYRFYRLRPSRIKLFDEHALGGATWVTVAVGAAGRLRWVRTESYVQVVRARARRGT